MSYEIEGKEFRGQSLLKCEYYDSEMQILIYLCIGLFAGFIGGMFGIGGVTFQCAK